MSSESLFVCDLNKISFDDIVSFTGVLEPEDSRAKEGHRLDYKREISSATIAKVVASFANSNGGLLIVGVEETKDGYASSLPGVPTGKSDLKTTLSNIIRTGVHPFPEHEIGIAIDSSSSPTTQFAVIRVESGRYPPYQATQQGTVPIRVNDQSVPASITQIESLFSARARYRESATRERPDVWVTQDVDQNGERIRVRSEVFVRVDVDPMREERLRFDVASETAIRAIIDGVFKDNKSFRSRRMRSFELEFRRDEFDFHRRWQIRDTGGLTFVSQVLHPVSKKIHILDVAEDVLRGVAAGRRVLGSVGNRSMVAVAIELQVGQFEVDAGSYPDPNIHLFVPKLPGLQVVGKPVSGPAELWTHIISHDVSNADVASDALWALLREHRQAEVSFDALQIGIRNWSNGLGLE